MMRILCLVALVAAVHSIEMDLSVSTVPGTMSVAIKLTNPLDQPILFLNRNSPIIFDHKHAYLVGDLDTNTVVEYEGYQYKYGKVEQDAGLIPFAAGETKSFSVDFASAYNFEKDHEYRVTLNKYIIAKAVVAGTEGSMTESFLSGEQFDLEFPPTSFTFVAHENYVLEFPNEKLYVKNESSVPRPLASPDVKYHSCSSSQESSFGSTVWPNSLTELSSSHTYLGNGKDCHTSYYETWFGKYDSKRYSTVTKNMDAIQSALGNHIEYTCEPSGCSPGVYAFVRPRDSTHNINVCATYFKASTSTYKIDSQPGTIIHETSHFNDVAGTDDIVYGQNGAKNLAKSDPDKAIQNADNYEYFNENHPQC